MANNNKDQSVLSHIDELVKEEERLYGKTWIRREFHCIPSKVAENLAFVFKMFASVARFSQT
jgi:hypothetical protein